MVSIKFWLCLWFVGSAITLIFSFYYVGTLQSEVSRLRYQVEVSMTNRVSRIEKNLAICRAVLEHRGGEENAR